MTICYFSGSNEADKLVLDTILKDLQCLDGQYDVDPNQDLHRERLHLQTQIDLLTTNTAEAQLLQSRRGFFFNWAIRQVNY